MKTLGSNAGKEFNGSDENKNEAELNGSQELTEEEVEEFIRKEQQAASEGNNADTSGFLRHFLNQWGASIQNRS